MNLKWLTHLAELRLRNIQVDLSAFEKERKLFQSILSVQVLHLAQVKCVGKFNAKLFCQLLKRTFPKVEQMFMCNLKM